MNNKKDTSDTQEALAKEKLFDVDEVKLEEYSGCVKSNEPIASDFEVSHHFVLGYN